MLTGIADKTVRFLTGAAICASIGTGNRLCVFFVGFLNIRRFEVVRTGMFTVGTSNRTRCCVGAAAPAGISPTFSYCSALRTFGFIAVHFTVFSGIYLGVGVRTCRRYRQRESNGKK